VAEHHVIVIKKHHEEHEHEHHGGSWKVAYADFVTAMMALFLLLWLLAALSKDTKQQLATYFQDPTAGNLTMGGGGGPNQPSMDLPRLSLNQSQRTLFTMSMKLKNFLELSPELKKKVSITFDANGCLVSAQEDVLFAPGGVALSEESHPLLDELITVMKEHEINMIIRGHTDDSEPPSATFPSNWELSATRAATALRYILSHGDIAISRLRAAGYADSLPLVPNTSPDNRARNRRVEFYFISPEFALM